MLRARALGFSSITARGFDIAEAQIKRARLTAGNLSSLPGVNLQFDVADLTDRLPESDAAVDLTLCLYSALSHLPVSSLKDISTEIARVTSGHFIATVRPVGSTPTGFVDSVANILDVSYRRFMGRLIAPESALLHFAQQVAMGRHQDAHVYVSRRR